MSGACGVRNGTYCCQRPEHLTGEHRSVFLFAGKPGEARFFDSFGEVRFLKPGWAA